MRWCLSFISDIAQMRNQLARIGKDVDHLDGTVASLDKSMTRLVENSDAILAILQRVFPVADDLTIKIPGAEEVEEESPS
jgi:hypothetical protein